MDLNELLRRAIQVDVALTPAERAAAHHKQSLSFCKGQLEGLDEDVFNVAYCSAWVWLTKDKHPIHVFCLEDKHLANILKYLTRKSLEFENSAFLTPPPSGEMAQYYWEQELADMALLADPKGLPVLRNLIREAWNRVMAKLLINKRRLVFYQQGKLYVAYAKWQVDRGSAWSMLLEDPPEFMGRGPGTGVRIEDNPYRKSHTSALWRWRITGYSSDVDCFIDEEDMVELSDPPELAKLYFDEDLIHVY